MRRQPIFKCRGRPPCIRVGRRASQQRDLLVRMFAVVVQSWLREG